MWGAPPSTPSLACTKVYSSPFSFITKRVRIWTMAPMSFCKLINNRERTHHPSNCAPKNLGQHSMDWSRLKSKLEAVAFTSNHRRSCKLSLPPILGNVWKYIIEGRASKPSIFGSSAHLDWHRLSARLKLVHWKIWWPQWDQHADFGIKEYGNHLGWRRRIKVLQKVKNVLLKSRCISQKNLEIAWVTDNTSFHPRWLHGSLFAQK